MSGYHELILGEFEEKNVFNTNLKESYFFKLMKNVNTISNSVNVDIEKEYSTFNRKLFINSEGYKKHIVTNILSIKNYDNAKLYLKEDHFYDPLEFPNLLNYDKIEKKITFNLHNHVFLSRFSITSDETVNITKGEKTLNYNVSFIVNNKVPGVKNSLESMMNTIKETLDIKEFNLLDSHDEKVLYV